MGRLAHQAEKLYDISATFVNMTNLWPESAGIERKPSASHVSARELSNKFLSILATFRDGNHPYLSPLIQAMSRLPLPSSAES